MSLCCSIEQVSEQVSREREKISLRKFPAVQELSYRREKGKKIWDSHKNEISCSISKNSK
jgi:hypothetical protein